MDQAIKIVEKLVAAGGEDVTSTPLADVVDPVSITNNVFAPFLNLHVCYKLKLCPQYYFMTKNNKIKCKVDVRPKNTVIARDLNMKTSTTGRTSWSGSTRSVTETLT